MISDWCVPNEWTGERCFILGGGPSLNPEIIPKLKGRVIAVNAAFEIAPHADALFWSDQRFLKWNKEELKYFLGKYLIARHVPDDTPTKGLDIKRLHRNLIDPLSDNPTQLSGLCSGSSAINLAYLFGAKEIILLGFDMQMVGGKNNFHSSHKVLPNSRCYDSYLKHFPPMAKSLAQAGIAVHNTSRNSRLDCFPKTNLENFL